MQCAPSSKNANSHISVFCTANAIKIQRIWSPSAQLWETASSPLFTFHWAVWFFHWIIWFFSLSSLVRSFNQIERHCTDQASNVQWYNFLHQKNDVLVLHRRSRFSKQDGKQWGRQENSQQRKFSIFGRAAGNCVHDNDTVICSAKTKSQIL